MRHFLTVVPLLLLLLLLGAAASRESARLHLLAVTADGRRCYFSFHPYVQRFYNPTSAAGSSTQAPNPAAMRPQALVAAFARAAVPAAAGVVAGRSALAAAG
jgi:hypothetical protein